MSTVAKPLHEPEENEAQTAMLLDGLVDTLDDALERSLRHQLGPRVREVIARHLPELVAQQPAEAPSPAPPARNGLGPPGLNVLIGLLNAITALDEHARRSKADGPTAKRDAACRDFLRQLSEHVKRGAVTVNRWGDNS